MFAITKHIVLKNYGADDVCSLAHLLNDFKWNFIFNLDTEHTLLNVYSVKRFP